MLMSFPCLLILRAFYRFDSSTGNLNKQKIDPVLVVSSVTWQTLAYFMKMYAVHFCVLNMKFKYVLM